jgi:titin
VYRGTTAGGESATAMASGVTTASYTDGTAANGTKYYYKVAAVNGGGTSGLSGEASATPEPSAPGTPTGLTATSGNSSVTLNWTAVSGATSYSVYRGTTAGGESATALASGVTTASYTDSTAANGTKYYYKVAAVNAGGTSGLSGEASATPQSPAPASIVNTAGGGQSAQVNAAFAVALQATVKDAGGNPVSGATVTFTAPGSGASGQFGTSQTATASTNAQGVASAPSFTANGIAGSYSVTASVAGVASSAGFALTNTATSSSTKVANVSATYNTASQAVTLTATVTSNGLPANGGTVTFNVAGVGSATAAVSNGQATAALQIPAKTAAGTYAISASYSGNASAGSSAGNGTLTIAKANPVLTWNNPADLVFGGSLGASQLNATANVAGSFVYTPPAGTVPPVGNNETLQATFTPTDTADYNTASKTVTLNVVQSRPPGNRVNLIATSQLARDPKTNAVIVRVTLANAGGADAAKVQLTSVQIDGTAASGLPISLGTIAAGNSASANANLPGSVGDAGTRHILRVKGTYNGGQVQMETRVTLP